MTDDDNASSHWERGNKIPVPLREAEEGMYCPVSPWYRHKWGRSKSTPLKNGSYTEVLRCRRCASYLVSRISIGGDVPSRSVSFVKTLNYETLSEWDARKKGTI